MSGVFWEQDKQPNLCEAASGFTFSTINLLVAIPMTLVDLAVSGLLFAWALVLSILVPAAEASYAGVTALAELLGITLAVPSTADLLAPGLAAGVLVHLYLWHRRGASALQLAGQCSFAATGLLWLASLHGAPAGLVVVSLALAFASMLPGLLAAMAANFKPTTIPGAAAGLSNLLSLESMLVIVVAAFSYPELLGGTTAEVGAAESFFVLLPFFACVLVHATLQQTEGCAAAVAAPAVMNGSVVGAAAQADLSSAEPSAAEEPAAAGDLVSENVALAEEKAPASSAEETVGEVEDTAAESFVAEEAVQPADETAQQSEPDGAVATPPAELKEKNILLAKISSRLSCLVAVLCGRVSALLGLLNGWLAALIALPWFSITLTVSTAGSHLVAAAAWAALAANQVAFLLPIFTLVAPCLLERWGKKLPAAWRSLVGQLSGLAVAGLHYSLVAGTQLEDD